MEKEEAPGWTLVEQPVTGDGQNSIAGACFELLAWCFSYPHDVAMYCIASNVAQCGFNIIVAHLYLVLYSGFRNNYFLFLNSLNSTLVFFFL